jgi:Flp pilus assembly protein TadG
MIELELLKSRLRRFLSREEGGISAFGVLVTGLLLLIVGAAADVTNLYRHRAKLQVAADIAAQGGIVALARGENAETARHFVETMIERNMPEAVHGQVITNPRTDLQILHYDPTTGELAGADANSPANAVVVRLQRSAAAGNSPPSVLMGSKGSEALSLSATSVAVLVPTRRCGNAEGIVAHGPLEFDTAPTLGPNFCLHSQTVITLPVDTRATDPLRLSLPDPSDCKGGCAPISGSPPDSNLQPMALNLVMPSARDHVARLAAGLVDSGLDLPEEAAFFATRPLGGDPEALREVGISADNLRAGDVVRLTPLQFSQMRERPSGLVYDVRCNTVVNDPRPVWERRLTLIGDGFNPTLRNLALVTDCAIAMDDVTRVEGALILMTGPGEARIEALPGATLGDPEAECDPVRRVRLMALGDMALPAPLALSNLSAVAGGTIRLESNSDHWTAPHKGLILHAGGAVSIEGSHSFTQCRDEATSDLLMPQMQVIAHIMPDLSGILAPPARPRPQTKMPGEKAKRLMGAAKERIMMDGEVQSGS